LQCTLARKLEERLAEGVHLGSGYTLEAAAVKRGPGPRVLYELRVAGRRVALTLVFCGIKPFYRPWMEVFSVSPSPRLECCPATPCSALEDAIIDLGSQLLGVGEPFYVDYTWDEESMRILGRRVPPAASRLGFKMLRAGFTWIKHWYFPEGYREGGEKLQGEKPASREAMARHLRDLVRELDDFIARWGGSEAMERAVYYARASRSLALELLGEVKD